jgi:DNA-directed RNA polymerase subunit H (RpoH/RPB5)
MLDLREIKHDMPLAQTEFEKAYSGISISIELKTDTPTILYIANTASFGKVELEKIIKSKSWIKHFIFIIDKNNVDMILTKTKNEYAYSDIKIDIMLYYEFIINPIEHELAPIYHMIVGKEKLNIFNEYGKDNIAKMLRSDIVARWFDAQPGDLFEIIKKTGMNTAPYSLKYRLVV